MFAQQPAPFKEPDRDVQSLLNLGHVRAEIEFLAYVILCKQKMEVSQIHNKEFHGNCSISKGCNLPSQEKERRRRRRNLLTNILLGEIYSHNLQGTIDYGIWYKPTTDPRLLGYTYNDWARSVDGMK
ncbi:hypothetical protein L3X38_015925 [Prunus dulcis]|uniref:Uncharacterized protein n=1 Tax=Prunus dulcis TaxID=3755 RepID=A0AAD4W640_PRUDU|nr:hypothetical protein L3X38_015925 [Prunus dulcis]